MNRTQHEAAKALNALLLRPGMTEDEYIAQVTHIVQMLPFPDYCKQCGVGNVRWPDRRDLDGKCHYSCESGHKWTCWYGGQPNPFALEYAL